MRLCDFPGCNRLPHGANLPHGVWDDRASAWVPFAEQHTLAQQMRERRDRINREHAEKIAADVIRRSNWIDKDDAQALDIATAAALQALTETESAR